MKGARISVCLLTFNHVNIIESTLRSILDQSLDQYEVIVSDDCSSDGTWEKVLELANGDARIRPLRTPENLGMPGNANFAVDHSDREFIALLHHDDLYRRDLLERWLELADAFADVAFVFNPYDVRGELAVFGAKIGSCKIDGQWFLREILFPRWGCAVRGTAFVRRSAWLSIGGMRGQFGLLADVDMWMRLSARWSVGFVAEPVITVRQDRPDYYPAEYQSRDWSWTRHSHLLNIHGQNRTEVFHEKNLPNWLRMQWFCMRVSIETTKWLGYGVVRKRRPMILESPLSTTEYDMWFLRLVRRFLFTVYSVKR